MKRLTMTLVAALLVSAGAVAAKENEHRRADRVADDSDDRARGKAADAELGMRGEYAKRGDKWLLRNDDISVWFHTSPSGRAKPQLKIFATDADGNKSGYKVKIYRLCEVDANATDCSGAKNKINLASADNWNTVVERDEANHTLTITMRLTDAQGIVGLVFHLRDDASTVKFDLEVANWRWEGLGSVVTGVPVPGSSPNRLLLEMRADEKHEGASDDEDAEDATVAVKDGFISWAPNATASYGPALTRTVNVTGFVRAANEDGERDGKIALRFDGDGGYNGLVYDPEFGVAYSSADAPSFGVPSLGLLAGLGAVGAAAFVAARRRFR